MWQSRLPRVYRIAGVPSTSIPANACARRGGAHGVDRHLDVAVGPVLEADRHRQARAELAVDLALGRARADRAPANGVGDVLRGDRVEELAADRQPSAEHLEQHARAPCRRPVLTSPEPSRCGSLIRPFQPIVVRGFSKYTRIAIRRSSRKRVRPALEPLGVVERGVDVVDAARPDDDQQAVVIAVEHRVHLRAAAQQHVDVLLGQRQLLEQPPRG